MGSAVHIGVGDGPLCFGLLIAATQQGPFDQHVVARPDTDHPPHYTSTIYRRDGSCDTNTYGVTSFTGPRDEVPPEMERSLDGADLVLVTVSIRDGIAHRDRFVRAVVDRCDAGAEIVFVACENSLTAGHEQLIADLESRGVACPRAIVDRVCMWPDPNGDKPHPRHVVSHEVGEWLIAADPDCDRLSEALADSPDVSFIPPARYDAYHARKAWLVNGVHVYVASSGRIRNQPDPVPKLLDKPRILTPIQELIEGMAAALELEHSLTVESEWALDRMRAFFMLPDSCRRILKSFSRRDTLPFVRGFEARIARPALTLHEHGGDVAPFVQVARDFCKLLQGGSHYADWYEIGPGELSEANDEATVEALRDALAGWFPESQLEREIANVDDALTTHRRAVAERSSQPDPNL